MGTMVYSLWVMQDLDHQPYESGVGAILRYRGFMAGVLKSPRPCPASKTPQGPVNSAVNSQTLNP